LKKNNIAVDIVLFGEIEENNDKLEKFLDKVNSSNNR
jgi:26S proteasome regulatory subunit N10